MNYERLLALLRLKYRFHRHHMRKLSHAVDVEEKLVVDLQNLCVPSFKQSDILSAVQLHNHYKMGHIAVTHLHIAQDQLRMTKSAHTTAMQSCQRLETIIDKIEVKIHELKKRRLSRLEY